VKYDHAENLLRNCIHAEWDSDPHLKQTPDRFARMLKDLTTPDDFDFTTFPNEGVDQMVIIKDIPFYTLCAHHVIPFYGYAHIGYVPDADIAGLSKFARTVKHFCKSLNVQEELTQTICNYLRDELQPVGVAVVMQAEHLCMTMRGAQVPGTKTTTSALWGCFRDPLEQARAEFFSAIGLR